jgi:hypothetical integral membrane protein (TIGR02206 family)
MPGQLHHFGLVHLVILAAVLLIAYLPAAIQRRRPSAAKRTRYLLAFLVSLSSVMLYAYMALTGNQMFPGHVPLELCDASVWLVTLSLLTLKPAVFDLAYYPALGGATMSLLTPNLPPDAPVFLTIQFFMEHGLIVAGVLYLVLSKQARPRPGSVGRSILFINLYAIVVGAFDAVFKTDYMFLRAKPATVSLLDYLGPWPWYILSVEAVGFVLFQLLYLPFREPAPQPAKQLLGELASAEEAHPSL